MLRSFTVVTATCALLLVGAAGAAAQASSHAEALAEGDPAATAPSFSEGVDGSVYKGRSVTRRFIVSNALMCLGVERGPDRCYDSAYDLQMAEAPPRAAASRARGPTARAAVDCGIYSLLFIYNGADWTGAGAALEDRFRWANLRAEVNNEGSSFLMGEYSGHLADGQDGGSYWYPGDTSACAIEDNLNRNGSGWNNRISSRYRN
jgi:hypothetical protein